MNEYFLIYILSIAAGLSEMLSDLGWLLFWLPLGAYIVVTVVYYTIRSDERGDVGHKRLTAEHAAREPTLRKIAYVCCTLGLCCSFVSSCIPNTRTVIEAYAIVEGSKVINADNAEAAGEAVGKRFDQFLGIIDKSLNGAEAVKESVDKAKELKDTALEKAKELKEAVDKK